jgi:outer membrane protein OmpA-like peptidoglycan-associated protein
MTPRRSGKWIPWALSLLAWQAMPWLLPSVAAPARLAPTVGVLLSRNPLPAIFGAWSGEEGSRLTVEVAGRIYELGAGGGLTADGQSWTLVPSAPLADGVYDVVAVSVDAAGETLRDETRDELEIDSTPPPPPTVGTYSGTYARPLVSGTWPHKEAVSLAVTFAGRTYVLGIDRQLVANDKGDWSLIPAEDVEAGTYDVTVLVADRAGNASHDVTASEVVVAASPSRDLHGPELDCQIEFDSLLEGEAIYFAANEAIIESASLGLVRRLAAAARRCPDADIEIVGHVGAEATPGAALAERRAAAVLEALVAEGIERERLTAKGEGPPTAAKGSQIEIVVRP